MWNKAEYRNKIEKNQITFKLNLNVLYINVSLRLYHGVINKIFLLPKLKG